MADGGATPVGAFEELERAVRHLGEELAFFRRRALDAERRVRELSAQAAAVTLAAPLPVPPDPVADAALVRRVRELEAENGELRDRLAEAAERTRALADRVRFVRQQAALAEEEPA